MQGCARRVRELCTTLRLMAIVFADDAVVPSGKDGNPDMNSTIELSGNVRMTFRQISFEAPRKR